MINISKTIYLFWNSNNQKEKLPEVEVIPFSGTTNEKKKIEKYTTKYSDVAEQDNIPLPGFTLMKSSRKHWGSADPTWLIIDPRGYLSRITNENLENILEYSGITEGLIQEKCVWARDDSQTKMTLLPISSPDYIMAVKNTELIEGKISMKDVQIGDKVLLQNELTGTYMGTVSLYGPTTNHGLSSKEYAPQTFLRRQVIEISPGKYYYQTNIKILKVLEKAENPISKYDAVNKMNNDIKNGIAFFSSYESNSTQKYYSVRGAISHVSLHAVPKPKMSIVEISYDDAISLFKESQSIHDSGRLILSDNKNNYIIDFPYFSGSQPSPKHNSFRISELEKINLEYFEQFSLKDKRKFGISNSKIHDIGDFTKFYKLIKHIKDETYI